MAADSSAADSLREDTMRVLILAATLALVAGNAHAAACKVEASNKKLAGAALNSFMTKCEKDAQALCDQSAADKKLAGAAKTSHVKKCMTDAVGN
jgi:nitrogen-specific signal transduction histidine kinase